MTWGRWVRLLKKVLQCRYMTFRGLNEENVVSSSFGGFDLHGGAFDESREIVEAQVNWYAGCRCYCSTKLSPVDMCAAEE